MLNYYLYKIKKVLTTNSNLFLIILSIIVIITIVFSVTKMFFTKNVLMAHGLGGVKINGKVYDINNTYEGFERSYKTGIRNFEVDIMLTNDNKVVAFHPYSKALYNRLNITNINFSYEEFMSGKYFETTNLNGLRPLDLEDVILLIKEYKNTKWVIHMHSMNTEEHSEIFLKEIINSKNIDEDILSRISIGINYQEELNILKKYNIENLIYTLYERDSRDEEVNTNGKLLDYLVKNKIKCVFNLLKNNNIDLMCYAENDFINQIKLHLIGFNFIETDNLK